MKPSAKEFQDSDIREPPSGVRMFEAGSQEIGVQKSVRQMEQGNLFSQNLRFWGSGVRGFWGENHLFQSVSRGGSRDALVRLPPMEPSANAFQDSDIRDPPSGVRMFEAGSQEIGVQKAVRQMEQGNFSKKM